MASKELTAALEAARAAADIIRAYYGRNPSVRIKPDQSPVTEADVRAEEVIRATLARSFPGYGFYGEETGQQSVLSTPYRLGYVHGQSPEQDLYPHRR